MNPAVTSAIAWAGGQLLGGVFIIISDALKASETANPPENMDHALIFTAVVALAVVPLPLALGLFGRKDKLVMRRVRSDERDRERRNSDNNNDGEGNNNGTVDVGTAV